MHRYHILSQLLHLHISVYVTILRVHTEYISVVIYKVQYIYIYIYLQYDVKTEHRVMDKKLKFVKMLLCPVCCCVHCVEIRCRLETHIGRYM